MCSMPEYTYVLGYWIKEQHELKGASATKHAQARSKWLRGRCRSKWLHGGTTKCHAELCIIIL